jgi:hypothetical protein
VSLEESDNKGIVLLPISTKSDNKSDPLLNVNGENYVLTPNLGI